MKRVLAILLLCVAVAGSMKAQHPLREQVAVAATSYGVLRLSVYPTKHWVHERRPDDTDYKSFPSGHTATAFLGAELVREEYGNAWGAGAYLIATGIGLQRIHADRHYAHDVLAGAAIGFLSARVGCLDGTRKRQARPLLSCLLIIPRCVLQRSVSLLRGEHHFIFQ